MFDINRYKELLKTEKLGRELLYFEQIDSTNIYAKSPETKLAEEGTVILAEFQSRGRGQHARNWIVEPGKNLTFTLILRPAAAERLPLFTLVAAFSVLEAVEKILPDEKISIKWPNDVLINGKKSTGILSETVFIGNKLDRLVIGIGLNVNQTLFEGSYRTEAISLAMLAGKELNRESLLAEIMEKLEGNYNLWLRKDPDIVKKLNKRLEGFGLWVSLEVDEKRLPDQYKFLGVNEGGALQVLNKDYEVNTFAYEQVRVRLD